MITMKKVKLSVVLIFILVFNVLKSQSLFKVGIKAGINFAQIDGDYQSGYDRLGYGFGLKGGIIIKKNFEIMTELLYNQKGTESKKNLTSDIKKADIKLSYAEVPLLFVYHLKKDENGIYKWSIYGGASYGRLLKSSIDIRKNTLMDTISTLKLAPDNLNKTDISLVLGLNYNVFSNFGINLSHSTALNFLYKDLTPQNPRVPVKRDNYNSFRNYFVSIKIFYDFIAPKPVKPKIRKIRGQNKILK
jgi:Outer membrane protein beta-barrel domain